MSDFATYSAGHICFIGPREYFASADGMRVFSASVGSALDASGRRVGAVYLCRRFSGWNRAYAILVATARDEATPTLPADTVRTRVPENAMPNRATRRDIRANRRARTADRIQRRCGYALW